MVSMKFKFNFDKWNLISPRRKISKESSITKMYVFNSIKKIEKKISKLEESYMEWKDDNNK